MTNNHGNPSKDSARNGVGIPTTMRERPSDQAVECFAHGVAHLIHELGSERGLAQAAQVLLELVDIPQLEETEHVDGRHLRAVSRR
jgi:hypothetical protein